MAAFMYALFCRIVAATLTCLLSAAVLAFQSSSGQTSTGASNAADRLGEARTLTIEGKLDEALAVYRQLLQQSPSSFEAHLSLGTLLDLKGEYAAARKEINQAIGLSSSPAAKAQAERALAISYAFEHKAAEAAEYEQQAFDSQVAANDFYAAGETADELARICIESGDLDNAYKWYKTGYETGLKQPDITDSRKNVWGFRWENAQARMAVRRGNREEAQKHVDAAKGYLDKASDHQQESFFPYLTGYVAFYGGDYQRAIAELQKANQRDPFVLSLLAQAYEKTGSKTQAMEYYRKVLTFSMHNPSNAFARPLALQKIAPSS